MKQRLATTAIALTLLSASALAGPVALTDEQLDGVTAGASRKGTNDAATGNPAEALSGVLKEVVLPLIQAGGAVTTGLLNDPAVQQKLRDDPRSAAGLVDFILNGLYGEVAPGQAGGLLFVPQLIKQMTGADEDPEGVTISRPQTRRVNKSAKIGRAAGAIPDDLIVYPTVAFGPTVSFQ